MLSQVHSCQNSGHAWLHSTAGPLGTRAGWHRRLRPSRHASSGDRSIKAAIARHWLSIAIPFLLILAAASAYGAVSDRPAVPAALMLTLNIVIGLLLFETLLNFVRRQLIPATKQVGRGDPPQAFDLIARCLRMAVLIGAIITVAESWIVNVLGLVDPGQWQVEERAETKRQA